jgi:Ca2+/Na+ antiporter
MEGKPEIALGDVLGSSLVNIALVLSLTLTLMGTPQRDVRPGLHHGFAFLVFPLLAFQLSDGFAGHALRN